MFYKLRGKDQKPNEIINLADFISVKGLKAQGNQLTTDKVRQINLKDPLPYEEEIPEEIEEPQMPSVDDIDLNNKGNEDAEDTGEQTTLF